MPGKRKVTAQNKGTMKVTKSQQHDYPSTDDKGLPVQVKKENEEDDYYQA